MKNPRILAMTMLFILQMTSSKAAPVPPDTTKPTTTAPQKQTTAGSDLQEIMNETKAQTQAKQNLRNIQNTVNQDVSNNASQQAKDAGSPKANNPAALKGKYGKIGTGKVAGNGKGAGKSGGKHGKQANPPKSKKS